MRNLRVFTFSVLFCIFCCAGCRQEYVSEGKLAYPKAHKASTKDIYHGLTVADPYRWLEDAESSETRTWVKKQNNLTAQYLDSAISGVKIKERLAELWDYERYSAPYKRGGRYFFWKNDGLQNQSVLYVQNSLDGEASIVINPNLLSEDGTVAVNTTATSEDGKLIAYGLSRSGSDEQEVKIRNVDTGRDYEEVLKWCRFTSLAWKHDTSPYRSVISGERFLMES